MGAPHTTAMDTATAFAVDRRDERALSDDDKPSEDKPAAPPAEEGADSPDRMDLPKWNRARVKRSQPAAGAEPDAFQQGVRDAGRTAVRRGPLVLGVIALLAAGIGGGIWWRKHTAEQTATSTRMLAVAAAWRARGRVDPQAVALSSKHPPRIPSARDDAELARNVEEALAEVEKDDGKARTLALLVRASSQQEQGDFASAQATYREFLTKAGDGHQLAFLAREGLALALEASGDTDGALAELVKLAGSEGDFYRDQALWQQARLLEQLGRTDEALAIYKQYATEYPLTEQSIARNEVREHLGKLDPSAVPPEPLAGNPLAGMVPP